MTFPKVTGFLSSMVQAGKELLYTYTPGAQAYNMEQEDVPPPVNLRMAMLMRMAFRQDGHKQYEQMSGPPHSFFGTPLQFERREDNSLFAWNESENDWYIENKVLNVTHDIHTQALSIIETLDSFDFRNAPNNSVLFKDDFPFLVLSALQCEWLDQKNGEMQAATALNFWSAYQFHDKNSQVIETIPLFQNDQVNPLAEPLLKETFKRSIDNFEYLEGNKYVKFLEQMRQLPKSEQQFLLVPDIQKAEDQTVSQAIKKNAHFNVFNRTPHKGQTMRIVPSVGMMQAFLNAQYDEPVKITPRLYLSSIEQIRECGLTDTRDMMTSVPSKYKSNRCPDKADGYLAPWYDFAYHDFYHAHVCSAIGKAYRRAGIAASDALMEFSRTMLPPTDRQGLEELAIAFIDMEYPAFIPKRQASAPPEQLFWEAINEQFNIHERKEHESRASFISHKTILQALQHLYSTFVHEKKGPSELNKESFKALLKAKKDNLETRINLATKMLMEQKPDHQPSKEEIAQIKFTLENEPILLLGKSLGLV
ncbi:MAG: hypothetical protein JSR58_02875 [Verrucomicrobia bacterium]|nr:hypothetical protein [Verrucomicrobiota bacterium]